MLILILELDALLNLKRWTVWALRGMLVVALGVSVSSSLQLRC